jgi:hypothetical protein
MTSERKRWKSGLQVPPTSYYGQLYSGIEDYELKERVIPCP